MKRKTFLVTGLLLALVIAGVASFYASGHPDGLEYVAGKTGFLDTADDSPASNSPFADYGTKGVDDDRLSGGVAGVAGSLMVLLVAGGLFWVLRRRTSSDADQPATVDAED